MSTSCTTREGRASSGGNRGDRGRRVRSALARADIAALNEIRAGQASASRSLGHIARANLDARITAIQGRARPLGPLAHQAVAVTVGLIGGRCGLRRAGRANPRALAIRETGASSIRCRLVVPAQRLSCTILIGTGSSERDALSEAVDILTSVMRRALNVVACQDEGRRVKNASGASVSLVADVAIVAANVVASECVLAVRLPKRLALIATIASLAQDIGARARRGDADFVAILVIIATVATTAKV